MHCPNCGADISAESNTCLYCGYSLPTPQPQPVPPEPQVVYVEKTVYKEVPAESPCTRLAALLLCFFFGYFGVHRFYMKKYVSGIIYLLTFGVFSLGWIFDLIVLLFGKPHDGKGRPMKWVQ